MKYYEISERQYKIERVEFETQFNGDEKLGEYKRVGSGIRHYDCSFSISSDSSTMLTNMLLYS